MAQHVEPDALDILGRHVAPALQEGAGAGGEGEGDGRARRGSVADHPFERQFVAGGLARGENDVDDVILHAVIDVDFVHDRAGLDDLAGIDHGRHVELRRGGRHQVEDLPLLRFRRVADAQFEHEPVELGFGKLVGALLLQGILRGEDQERIGQLVGLIADGHLPLLHRFEQRALDLGRGAVDLVGEDQVREERAVLDRELARARVVNQRADQVRREQVGGELDALKTGLDTVGQRFDRERLCEAGNPFQEDVSVGEQAREQAVHQIFLAHHHSGHFRLQRRDPAACVADFRRDFFSRFRHVRSGCLPAAGCADKFSDTRMPKTFDQKFQFATASCN